MARAVRTGVAGGLVLLVVAWVGASPPGAAPDEVAHFVKALGVATGQGVGTPVVQPDDEPYATRDEFRRSFTYEITLPQRLEGIPAAECFALRPERTAACARPMPLPLPPDRTVTSAFLGPEQPFAYLIPGLAALPFADPDQALLAGRSVLAAQAAALLVAAALLSTGRIRLVGLLVAVTPMVVFLAASLSMSGLESAAAVCHVVALLALVRAASADGDPAPAVPLRAVWTAWGASGVALAVARPLGPAWVLGGLALLLVLAPPRRLPALLNRPVALAASSAVTVATVVSAWWTLVIVPHPAWSWATVAEGWSDADDALLKVGRELVGVFGWTTVTPPAALAWGWAAAAAGLVVAGLVAGGARERIALVLVLLSVLVLAVALELVANAPFGFAVQGRYVLPAAVAAPLVAAHVVAGAAARRPAHRHAGAAVLPLVLVLAVTAQVTAWWWSARRHAVTAEGPLTFLGIADAWEPLGGWTPWLVVLVVAATLPLAAAALDLWSRTLPYPRATPSSEESSGQRVCEQRART